MSDDRVLTLDEVIAQHIRNVLERTKGNLSQAARLLGVHRSRLRRWERKIARTEEARTT